MAETYFNRPDGRLYIGEAAVAEAMEQPGTDLVPLVELLQAPELEVSGEYAKQRGQDWSAENCVELGQWVMGLVAEKTPEDVVLERRYIHRLYALGIGPDDLIYRRRFGPFWKYAEAVGVRNVKSSDKFSDYTLDQYVASAAGLARELGRKPQKADYQAHFDAFEGPGVKAIITHVGSITRLNELIGYPDFKSWEDDDFVDWGVKVRLANEGVPFRVKVMLAVASKGRGPSLKAIQNHFGSISNFQALVEEELQVRLQEQKEQDALMMAQHDELAERGKLVLPDDMDDAARLRTTAKYLVVRKCLPEESSGVVAAIAARPPSRLLESLQSKNPRLTAGFVETTAVALDVFDYIWPMDEWRTTLRINP